MQPESADTWQQQQTGRNLHAKQHLLQVLGLTTPEEANMHSEAAMCTANQATAHNTQLVSGLICVDGDTPRESCDGDRDFANASAASVESMLPACEFADVLLLLLSLIVPGKERPFRKLNKDRGRFRLKHVVGTVSHTHNIE
jgi:hypothetical protein